MIASFEIRVSAAVPEGSAYQMGGTLVVHPMHGFAPAPVRRKYATTTLGTMLGGRRRNGSRVRSARPFRRRRAAARRLVAQLWQAERT